MSVVKISFRPRSKTYFSVTVHSVHSNTLRDAQKSCIRMISRHTSRVFCELRSRKTPRRMSPVNSNLFHTSDQLINIFHFLSLKECSHTCLLYTSLVCNSLIASCSVIPMSLSSQSWFPAVVYENSMNLVLSGRFQNISTKT